MTRPEINKRFSPVSWKPDEKKKTIAQEDDPHLFQQDTVQMWNSFRFSCSHLSSWRAKAFLLLAQLIVLKRWNKVIASFFCHIKLTKQTSKQLEEQDFSGAASWNVHHPHLGSKASKRPKPFITNYSNFSVFSVYWTVTTPREKNEHNYIFPK